MGGTGNEAKLSGLPRYSIKYFERRSYEEKMIG
jgi:hypothetical protein